MNTNDGFTFIKACNEHLHNTNDYNIARVLLENLSNIQNLSLEKIAQEANISIASVSRFISKCGFTSFQDFKNSIQTFNNIKFHRSLSHTQRFMRTTPETMSLYLYDDAINNLNQTQKNLDINKLIQITHQLTHSRTITILGDSHELDDFYTLQLDLTINNIPTYLFNIHDNTLPYINFLKEDDTVIYIDVYDGWFDTHKENILKKIKQKHITLICIVQEPEKFIPYADIIYVYGIKNSLNDGYYSLPYISRILSELLYHNI